MTSTNSAAPQVFTQEQLDWLPWIEPLDESELTERHHAGLVDASRAQSPYFRLLARDPDTLGARTRTDKDIFYNPDAGLPRAERELAAAATSRANGCIYGISTFLHYFFTYLGSKWVSGDHHRLAGDKTTFSGLVNNFGGRLTCNKSRSQ